MAGQDRIRQLVELSATVPLPAPQFCSSVARSTMRTPQGRLGRVCNEKSDSEYPKGCHNSSDYGLTPLDTYLAAFGPALEVISSAWPIARDEANPLRPNDPFSVMPNDALEVARDVVFDSRRQQVSQQWAESDTDTLTEFYILSQDATGSARMTFDEANMGRAGYRAGNREPRSQERLYQERGEHHAAHQRTALRARRNLRQCARQTPHRRRASRACAHPCR